MGPAVQKNIVYCNNIKTNQNFDPTLGSANMEPFDFALACGFNLVQYFTFHGFQFGRYGRIPLDVVNIRL